MTQDQQFDTMLRNELRDILPNVIWENEQGEYEVFGKYTIVPEKPAYRVFCAGTEIGVFNTTRTAVSWCIADKYQRFNLAREVLLIDNLLGNLTNDIFVRAGVASRSRKAQFREDIETKLETKIIRKKHLEIQLAKCIKTAKYLQQQGFSNETARTGHATSNKTSR